MRARRVFCWIAISGFWLGVLRAYCQDAVSVTGNVANLQRELDQVRGQIQKASEEIAEHNKRLFALERDIVYTNLTLKPLYDQMKALEKELYEKRKLLNEKMQDMPEFREIQKERKKIFDNLAKLKDKERLIKNEITAGGGGRPR